MDNKTMPSPEELQKLLEKAKRDAEAALAKLTPEERAKAEKKAKKLIEEDAAAMQKLVGEAAAVAAGASPKAARECPHCLAPAGSGKTCEYCGSLLEE